MKLIDGKGIIEAHDYILRRSPGLSGISDAGRAESVAFRINNALSYGEIEPDLFVIAGLYTVAIARGHIFNDGNKRTAFVVAMQFLLCNGITLRNDRDVLESAIVEAATGEADYMQLAAIFRSLQV
ncbi:type II toxin-antitoxin system death-on-curing family toxin [Pantoea sp. ICBG 1758]|uniref:type II toxin-antitoxin system death-on-curing family toxin n=1 Tax=Pantoea sp. ICBG 1758 TaxID=2071682 RepID=UPI000CE2D540|nr:type II toxin-antitoxin system death-on-curing family toxin [Pantoea sp. ICBG 1758]PPC63935.1 type II toxin-antitoxin system death-on-curing family toxin [Pantoea sp. ICBG 1758]